MFVDEMLDCGYERVLGRSRDLLCSWLIAGSKLKMQFGPPRTHFGQKDCQMLLSELTGAHGIVSKCKVGLQARQRQMGPTD